MKRLTSGLLSIVIILIFSGDGNSQGIDSITEINNFSLYNTKAEFVTSEIMADSFFILISVPDGYYNSEKRYPVLYVLDGDIAFGMAASISRYLQIGNNIPEIIVVGIGYGAINKSAGEKRRRDYRPAQSGGAEDYLKFLDEELIPFIDENYRTILGDRTINGYSLGGLFCLYALFTKPETFNKYIIGNPNLSWEDYSIFTYEENSVEKISDKKLDIFISVGTEVSEERYFDPIDSLVTNIQKHNYPNVILKTKVFDGSTHLVGPPECISHGLIAIFKK